MSLGFGDKLPILVRSPLDSETLPAPVEEDATEARAIPSLRWRPSRYNIRATATDGRMVLWNSLRGTMSVFLCLSAPKFPVFNRWLRLVLTSALDEMTDTLNPPKLPV